MVFSLHKNINQFRSADTVCWVDMKFPTKAPVYSICHRPESNLIVVSLVDLGNSKNNECCNVYAVDDKSGRILWRIKEGEQKDSPNLCRKPYYHTLMELPEDPNLYVLDTWNTKWKIDLETGDVEEFERGNGH